jgi:hypothetical protein
MHHVPQERPSNWLEKWILHSSSTLCKAVNAIVGTSTTFSDLAQCHIFIKLEISLKQPNFEAHEDIKRIVMMITKITL